LSTTRPAKSPYTADEQRSRGDILESLLNTDGWFEDVRRDNHRRFTVTDHDGRQFVVEITEKP